jgi:hypothetical protein
MMYLISSYDMAYPLMTFDVTPCVSVTERK